RDRVEGRLRVAPVVKSVPRPRYAEHRKLRNLLGDSENFPRALLGSKPLGDDAGTAFVGAIIFAIAVIALDIAGGSHGHVHAREMMVGLFGIAGMVFNLLPNLRIEFIGALR